MESFRKLFPPNPRLIYLFSFAFHVPRPSQQLLIIFGDYSKQRNPVLRNYIQPIVIYIQPIVTYIQPIVTYSVFGKNVLLSPVFSKILSRRISHILNNRNKFSHSYKTTCKIIVLYVLMCSFLDSWWKSRRYWMTDFCFLLAADRLIGVANIWLIAYICIHCMFLA
jgi:hypothetical protein